MFACWLTYVYFNVFTNNVNKKMTKKELFLAAESTEDTENSIIFNRGFHRLHGFCFRHRLTRIHTDSSIVSNRGLARIYQVRRWILVSEE